MDVLIQRKLTIALRFACVCSLHWFIFAILSNDTSVFYCILGNGSWIPPPHVPQNRALEHTNIDDQKNVWLFNIKDDPNEHNDLSNRYPSLVHHLLDKLLVYNETAVPPRYPPSDPRCDPKLHGGVWGPWE